MEAISELLKAGANGNVADIVSNDAEVVLCDFEHQVIRLML